MTRHGIALTVALIVALGAAAPAVMHAQQVAPCKAMAPGARCAHTPLSNVWRVDFGAPKLAPDPEPAADLRRWAPLTHHGPVSQLMRVPTLEVPALLDHPIDCKMAKPGSTTLDSKIIQGHRGTTVLSGRIIPVAPCKGQ